MLRRSRGLAGVIAAVFVLASCTGADTETRADEEHLATSSEVDAAPATAEPTAPRLSKKKILRAGVLRRTDLGSRWGVVKDHHSDDEEDAYRWGIWKCLRNVRQVDLWDDDAPSKTSLGYNSESYGLNNSVTIAKSERWARRNMNLMSTRRYFGCVGDAVAGQWVKTMDFRDPTADWENLWIDDLGDQSSAVRFTVNDSSGGRALVTDRLAVRFGRVLLEFSISWWEDATPPSIERIAAPVIKRVSKLVE